MKISEIFTPDELNEIIENGIKRGIEIAKDEMDMPKTSQEFKEKLSLANNEKSIDDVEFRFNDNLDFDIPMPKTSQEFKEMVKL